MDVLNRNYLIQHDQIPTSYWNAPERVLQFGTGVLLRGLCDCVIDEGNKKGIFEGRIVVVKSTSQGSLEAFEQQDNVYTLCMRGRQNGSVSESFQRVGAISRVIDATLDWSAVLQLAQSPDLEIVLSNTTEMGLRLEEKDSILENPPHSFPAKLLAVLHTRYQAFQGDPTKGLVVLPTELIDHNGHVLRQLLVTLANRLGLDLEFIKWLNEANYFCDTLVDRIVSGTPAPAISAKWQDQLGYKDSLLIVSEPYLLWAIEGNEQLAHKIQFAKAHPGVIIQEDISLFRTLKLRLLNAFHTINCGLAWLCGFTTVYEAASEAWFGYFMEKMLHRELIPALPDAIDREQAKDFADKVLERFKNPFLNHHWLDISFQYTTKMQTRCVPLLQSYIDKQGKLPTSFVFGMAGFIYFMRIKGQDEKGWFGHFSGKRYYLRDDFAPRWYEIWNLNDLSEVVRAFLAEQSFWLGTSFDFPGLEERLVGFLSQIQDKEENLLRVLAQNEADANTH
ncbi:MAG TPA: tagaturonate reductase [Saprospiraceae bacterium]|nr:tagaturonate reductase [Saprospiraceae bacterium]HMQ81435.1 tagaturonate reductase [Saprospiraceae bacterium]